MAREPAQPLFVTADGHASAMAPDAIRPTLGVDLSRRVRAQAECEPAAGAERRILRIDAANGRVLAYARKREVEVAAHVEHVAGGPALDHRLGAALDKEHQPVPAVLVEAVEDCVGGAWRRTRVSRKGAHHGLVQALGVPNVG